jgi:hypothetical protein
MFANHDAFEQGFDIRIDFCEIALCDLLCFLHGPSGTYLPAGHPPACPLY